VAIITGRYQTRLPVGLEEPVGRATQTGIGLPPEHSTLPSLLRKADYGTTLVGKWHLGGLPAFSPLKSGYDPAVVESKLFWRYKALWQRAARIGDWKHLKILDNTFLFDLVDDPLERANLRERRKDIYGLSVSGIPGMRPFGMKRVTLDPDPDLR
jgi:hypothetical protein